MNDHECRKINLYCKIPFYCVSLKVIDRARTINQPIVSSDALNQANSRFGLLHTVRFMPERDWGKVGDLFQCRIASK